MPDKQYSFSEAYKYEIFLLWYNAGKVPGAEVHRMIPEAMGRSKPSATTISYWIKDRFIPQAEQMDTEISEQLEARMVKEKVEMLSRHATVGTKMQDIGMDYIDNNKDSINANAAVRLVIEGVRIERDSRGMPQAIEKMMSQTDEDLLEEVKQLMDGAEVEILED